jgi:hypothetical protein
MFLAVGRFELNGCFRTLICRYSGDQGMGKFAPQPTFAVAEPNRRVGWFSAISVLTGPRRPAFKAVIGSLKSRHPALHQSQFHRW